ncbi:carbohydrate porin [Vibrio metoecus]|uniref:carbohydrate porin n=1 Tax=Vibrio TaxID=662 RepID=UPI000BA8FC25|nr:MULTISPECIES: carbohydrate porin [Vibrio]EIJ0934189.1 carbohydrate porin [Vibrio cholerae]PAR48473.1 maltoporin [Vibrio metoecus]TXX36601.1 carbohydrate porin [Vibrio cholerae]GHW64776.1 maltoporin [Vibrio cholerae]
MKLSKLTLACLVATAGLSAVPVVHAEKSDGFEFHGYFRAGALYSKNDDFKRSKFPASKERLGRLGIESDNHFELALQKNFENDDGQKIRIKTRVGADNAQSAGNNQLGTNADAANSSIGMVETFVEFDGVTETGTLWGGTRFYGKDNYIFMTDFFYTDMSGTGVGIEGVQLGDYKWDFAYIASDNAEGDWWALNANNPMHSVHVGVDLDGVELHAMGKYLPDNFVDGTEYASNGIEMTAIVHSDKVFGLSDKGFTKYIAQVGKGLGSGQLLGGTLTTYNAWKPGNGALEGPSKMKKVESGDVSARALVWGGYFFENGVSIFHSIQGQYNDLDNGGKDSWASAMIRPSFPVSKNFFIATEAGYQYNKWEDANGVGDDATNYKLTVAPTIIVPTGFGPAPEIRFLATYLDGSERDKADLLVGIQADMWW